ncbi:class II fructose-bisphosphate aldolase [Desulfosporosinus sp. BICA1-9]|uniref:class II fructose-bisphosphate aldolase n=1 Tax=Desulfosporosinus sp. BICA1-9 TaxID=1531958 RepID=UPI00054C5945|nr:class II fructose-bisphosphate aldolase [Desulfosporosinus sp. BICA1-9]KJS48996.1 MAG: tagatose-bisphosphate aldolase [Peptococcaceae bacterium BRH_c23]KJS78075.1 MAG: tagatose-bisphosphate aldolase [Desulfosporosinus sp. BICA1-9]HBW34136.1 ketose-bisphosphate aldolase [Desulfosporosinus sp.]
MLEPSIHLLNKARQGHYAVPAFNFHNLEILQAIIETAEKQHSPVILQISPIYLEKIGDIAAAAMAQEAAKAAKVPVALHLDHSNSLQWIEWALAHGFTSVMIDASALPLDENIALARKTVELARAQGATSEAELGHIGGIEDAQETGNPDMGLADPVEALKLVTESGIDTFAPAVGTAHGLYKFPPNINFSLIEKICSLVKVPLVLHGGSGIPDDMIREAIKKGIAKVNVGTELKVAWAKSMAETLITEQEPWKAVLKVREAVGQVVEHKISLCGSNGKA